MSDEVTYFIVPVEVRVYAEDAEHAAELVEEFLFPIAGEDNPIAFLAFTTDEISSAGTE